jgi:transcriptional regulator with XRE-family HTH domain
MKDILNRITGIRKAKKISQKEISESLGISQAAYAKFESGNSITVDRLYKIAEFLGVSINEIIDIGPTKLNEDLNESLILEIESLKKQNENLIKDSQKDEQIIDLHKQLHSRLKNTILDTYFSAMTFISFDILKQFENDEQKDLIFGILYGLTEEFKKELIENECYSISELELFMDKRRQLFELEVLKKKNQS